MKLAIGIPGVGEVPAAFAFDLARLTAHIAATQFDVELRLIASTDVPSAAQRDEILGAAREWSADLILFPETGVRIPADALDKVFLALKHESLTLPKSKIEVVTH